MSTQHLEFPSVEQLESELARDTIDSRSEGQLFAPVGQLCTLNRAS